MFHESIKGVYRSLFNGSVWLSLNVILSGYSTIGNSAVPLLRFLLSFVFSYIQFNFLFDFLNDIPSYRLVVEFSERLGLHHLWIPKRIAYINESEPQKVGNECNIHYMHFRKNIIKARKFFFSSKILYHCNVRKICLYNLICDSDNIQKVFINHLKTLVVSLK